VVYRSPAGLADLALGLLRGSVAWFEEPLDVCRARGARASMAEVTFRLRRRPDDVADE